MLVVEEKWWISAIVLVCVCVCVSLPSHSFNKELSKIAEPAIIVCEAGNNYRLVNWIRYFFRLRKMIEFRSCFAQRKRCTFFICTSFSYGSLRAFLCAENAQFLTSIINHLLFYLLFLSFSLNPIVIPGAAAAPVTTTYNSFCANKPSQNSIKFYGFNSCDLKKWMRDSVYDIEFPFWIWNSINLKSKNTFVPFFAVDAAACCCVIIVFESEYVAYLGALTI